MKNRIKLSVAVAATKPVPTVGNIGLRRSAFSRFGLDKHSEHGFPFESEDD